MIKDSGDRTEFETGAKRDMHAGKGRMDLLPWYGIMEVSKHCEEGALKYGEHNVDKGIPLHSLLDSAARHLAKYMVGMDDEDHLRAACWNLLWALNQHVTHPELDDGEGAEVSARRRPCHAARSALPDLHTLYQNGIHRHGRSGQCGHHLPGLPRTEGERDGNEPVQEGLCSSHQGGGRAAARAPLKFKMEAAMSKFKDISLATIVRTLCLAFALFNQVLSACGHPMIPLDNAQMEQFLTSVITVIAALVSWWKNNSFTKEAIEADKVYDKLVASRKRGD